ncbi:hypothetical protein BKA66DRAFT_566973 [Pyrenochaeta sp. MPI-SDFR-AT-0127]|nr:hypothetical protein BKA66DRAFT_566973 [Pyrenochaeta sp. MPI-SDFR-AT-0127]
MTGHGLHIELLMLPVDKRNKVWLGVIEEYAGQHNEGNQVGIAIVLRQSGNENALLFHRAGGCPPIRSFYPHRKKRASRGPRLRVIYLQDSAVTPLRTIDVSVHHGLLRCIHPWPRGSKIPNHRPRISISLASVNEAGFFLSSLYPPIGQGLLITRKPSFHFGRSFESLDCEGPQNRIFYSIFASDRENRFAVKIQVQWGAATAKSLQMSFCKLNVNLHGTALEHYCETQIGWKAPQFENFTQWNEYVNLWSPSTLGAGHIRVVGNSHRHPLATSPIDYSLDWVTGYYLEGRTVL